MANMAYVWHFFKSSQINLSQSVILPVCCCGWVLIVAPQWAMIDCCKHLLLFSSWISISRQQQFFPLLVKCHQQCFLFNCRAPVETWTNNGTDRCIVHLSDHTQYTQIVIFVSIIQNTGMVCPLFGIHYDELWLHVCSCLRFFLSSFGWCFDQVLNVHVYMVRSQILKTKQNKKFKMES